MKEYAILVELYKVSGAEIIWQTKDKQFIEALIDETVELRKSPEDKRKEQQQRIGKEVNKVLQNITSISVIDSTTGQAKTLDLSALGLGGIPDEHRST